MSETQNFRYAGGRGAVLPTPALYPLNAIFFLVGVGGQGEIYLRDVNNADPPLPIWKLIATTATAGVVAPVQLGPMTLNVAGGAALADVPTLWGGVAGGQPAPVGGTITQISAKLSVALATALDLRLRVNGVATGPTYTVPAGTTTIVLATSTPAAAFAPNAALALGLTTAVDPDAFLAAFGLTLQPTA